MRWCRINRNTKVLTDFEVGGLQRGAGEEPGEHHVDGNREAAADVAFSYLDVLDLCGISGVTFGTTWKKTQLEKPAALQVSSNHIAAGAHHRSLLAPAAVQYS